MRVAVGLDERAIRLNLDQRAAENYGNRVNTENMRLREEVTLLRGCRDKASKLAQEPSGCQTDPDRAWCVLGSEFMDLVRADQRTLDRLRLRSAPLAQWQSSGLLIPPH